MSMVTLFEQTVPIATATGASTEFYYLASAYSEDVQTARIEGPGVIELKYFLNEAGSSLGGSTVSLDPVKGDYLRFGGSLVTIDMVDPWGNTVLGEVYPRLSDVELETICDGGKACESKRWRGLRVRSGKPEPLKVQYTKEGCLRGDLIQGSNCQAVENLPSLVTVNMPTLELQSDGVVYTYDWSKWAEYVSYADSKIPNYRFTGYSSNATDTLTKVPMSLDSFHTAENVITAGAGGRGYGFTDDERQATNGAGLYEDAAKLKITVTEGSDLNWLLWAAAAVAGIAVLNRSL